MGTLTRLGEPKAERRARLRAADAPRRKAAIEAAILQLGKSMRRVEAELRSLESELPHRPTCCVACAMGHHPRWKDLADKAERQDAEHRRLTAKLKVLP